MTDLQFWFGVVVPLAVVPLLLYWIYSQPNRRFRKRLAKIEEYLQERENRA